MAFYNKIHKLNTSSLSGSEKFNPRPKLSFTLMENDSDATTGWKGPMGGYKVSFGIEIGFIVKYKILILIFSSIFLYKLDNFSKTAKI